LTVLANLLNGIAQADPHTRDFTFHGLREALAELVARFPVYRTYVTDRNASEQDRRYVHWALSQSKKHSRAADTQVLDFIAGLLVAGVAAPAAAPGTPDGDSRIARFIARFQQYTAPVTAKAVEDTACYVYNRLVALNEVGGSPTRFGISPHAFHTAIRQRREAWPDAMVSTSTHDTKRSEDVRTRIDVLSEMPDEWHCHLVRWSRLNRGKKRLASGHPAPSRNDEYFIYQTLVGAWPLNDEAGETLRERLQAYLLKAVKEAKLHTSWLNPDEEYEDAVTEFVDALLRNPSRNAFLSDFIPFQRQVAHYGLLNGLSQTLLKLTLPGVPDTYQGSETWTFSLVDPDNRRPVDYPARRAMLEALQAACRDRDEHTALLGELLDHLADGRAKLYLTWRILELRRRMPDFFRHADYVGLPADGTRSDNVVAFARHHAGHSIVCAAARRYRGLIEGPEERPCGTAWSDTVLTLPGGKARRRFRDLLSGATVDAPAIDGGTALACVELFAHWPVALLVQLPAPDESTQEASVQEEPSRMSSVGE
jgi:(1->4)-alpha-D-glucan 1-alpha-D-glucosylmutase